MYKMLDADQKKQFSEILEELARQLDVTQTEFETITKSYEAVGSYLAETDSLLAYKPSIHPQGSFLLGTVVRPICENDDLDIDLVCELERIPDNWTQYHLKNVIGDRLKESERYKKMLDDEGKRCWTLLYGDNKYHLDVLPALVCEDYYEVVRKYFSAEVEKNPETLAIHITDNTREDYTKETNKNMWMISNPFGYAQWFLSLARKSYIQQRQFSAEAKIDPVPRYSADRYVLQRVVQLLKRHRDKMFGGDEDKPISIIITTLAARTYEQERDLFTALRHIADHMVQNITVKRNEKGEYVKWIENPVNPTENFADRWPGTKKEEAFYNWIEKLRKDMDRLELAAGKGLEAIKRILDDMFDKKVSAKTYAKYAKDLLEKRKKGNMKIAATGTLGLTGTLKVAAHSFYGSKEK